ncbi:hypothetical protein [Bradyrhizobium sp. MOS002]|uniref:hypothetical protein n=1 Tax=Bradyrhizobium sp. MOS002 TaxID=2133947 RepID=UPI0011B251CB|nr:hypothetical protein [Bradyrhizobium sp. MOS002]
MLKNPKSGRVITVYLLLADGRQLSAARGEGRTIRAHSEHLTGMAILICNSALNLFVSGCPHGWTRDEKRVQPTRYQYGNEQRVTKRRERESVGCGSVGFGFGHKNLS